MALPTPELDDRKFQDIVDEAKRLIPQYCPEWTNHNLSDPGVALIELFAWMSEMVLYRLNQVPDRFFAKFLELVGIEPFPPSVSRVDLTFWLSTVLDHVVVVPAGTQVATVGAVDEESVVFSTSEELRIAPPVMIAACTSRGREADGVLVDVWDELRYEGGAVVCFPSDPLTPGDAFYVGFENSLAGNAIRLTVGASVEGIGVDPANPPLAWQVWSGEAWIDVPVHTDTTGGLNRDGAVQLLVPMAHEPLTVGGSRAYWLRARLLDAAPGQPPYHASQQIRSIHAESLGGTVAAEHAVDEAGESLGRSDGTPGQSFAVRRAPVLPRREDEAVRLVGIDGSVDDWTEVEDFTLSAATCRHVVSNRATGVRRFRRRVCYADG